MTYGSLFSGAGGFDLGFDRAGMTCRWQVEIDPTANDVLARNWPAVERFPDVCDVDQQHLTPVDVICGGYPCQDLSVAGKRKGLAGERSGLFWELARIVGELRPRFLVWENVAGLLSSDGGRDIRRVCSALAERNYFGCVRTLDGRYFGVPQRRRRLFGVFARGRAGARRGAEILALAESLRGDSPAGEEAREGVTGTLTPGAHPGGFNGRDIDAGLYAFGGNNTAGRLRVAVGLNGRSTCRQDFETETFIVHGEQSTAMTGNGDAAVAFPAKVSRSLDTTGGYATNQGGTLAVSRIAFGSKDHGADAGELSPTLRAGGHKDSHANAGVPPAVAFVPDVAHMLRAEGFDASEDGTGRGTPLVPSPAGTVRRLTPRECEWLMGWPDDHTRYRADGREIPDGPRYRLCGNGVIANVAEWIGRRLMECP